MRCSRLSGKYREQWLCNLREISQYEKDLFFTLKRRKLGYFQVFFPAFHIPYTFYNVQSTALDYFWLLVLITCTQALPQQKEQYKEAVEGNDFPKT